MGYWGNVSKIAIGQAIKDAKLDSVVTAVIALLAQGLIAICIFIGLGQITNATAVTRVLTALTPFLTFPVAFIIRAALAPPVIDQALRAELDQLRNPPPPERFDDGIYQYGTLVGIVSDAQEIGDQMEFAAIEDSDRLNRREAFVYRDMLLFLNASTGYIGTQTITTVSADGPKSLTRRAVMTGVRCHVIGSTRTVAR